MTGRSGNRWPGTARMVAQVAAEYIVGADFSLAFGLPLTGPPK
ncbi:MAG: hypothetical protein R2874_02445 [Desulfobacterales bacterium]